MIKVSPTGISVEERLKKIEQSINSSPVVLPFAIIDDNFINVGTAGANFGGIAVDRSWSRTLLPDARWVVRAAGVVDPSDANGVTVRINYIKDNATAVTLGSATYTGGGQVKKALGPFDVFKTVGVPAGETIPVIVLNAQKITSGLATMAAWNIWLELRASRQ